MYPKDSVDTRLTVLVFCIIFILLPLIAAGMLAQQTIQDDLDHGDCHD